MLPAFPTSTGSFEVGSSGRTTTTKTQRRRTVASATAKLALTPIGGTTSASSSGTSVVRSPASAATAPLKILTIRVSFASVVNISLITNSFAAVPATTYRFWSRELEIRAWVALVGESIKQVPFDACSVSNVISNIAPIVGDGTFAWSLSDPDLHGLVLAMEKRPPQGGPADAQWYEISCTIPRAATEAVSFRVDRIGTVYRHLANGLWRHVFPPALQLNSCRAESEPLWFVPEILAMGAAAIEQLRSWLKQLVEADERQQTFVVPQLMAFSECDRMRQRPWCFINSSSFEELDARHLGSPGTVFGGVPKKAVITLTRNTCAMANTCLAIETALAILNTRASLAGIWDAEDDDDDDTDDSSSDEVTPSAQTTRRLTKRQTRRAAKLSKKQQAAQQAAAQKTATQNDEIEKLETLRVVIPDVGNKWYLRPCLACRALTMPVKISPQQQLVAAAARDAPVAEAMSHQNMLQLAAETHDCTPAAFYALFTSAEHVVCLPFGKGEAAYVADVYRHLEWLRHQTSSDVSSSSRASAVAARYQAMYVWTLELAHHEIYSGDEAHWIVRFLWDERVQLHRSSIMFSALRTVLFAHFAKRMGVSQGKKMTISSCRTLLKRARLSRLGQVLQSTMPVLDDLLLRWNESYIIAPNQLLPLLRCTICEEAASGVETKLWLPHRFLANPSSTCGTAAQLLQLASHSTWSELNTNLGKEMNGLAQDKGQFKTTSYMLSGARDVAFASEAFSLGMDALVLRSGTADDAHYKLLATLIGSLGWLENQTPPSTEPYRLKCMSKQRRSLRPDAGCACSLCRAFDFQLGHRRISGRLRVLFEPPSPQQGDETAKLDLSNGTGPSSPDTQQQQPTTDVCCDLGHQPSASSSSSSSSTSAPAPAGECCRHAGTTTTLVSHASGHYRVMCSDGSCNGRTTMLLHKSCFRRLGGISLDDTCLAKESTGCAGRVSAIEFWDEGAMQKRTEANECTSASFSSHSSVGSDVSSLANVSSEPPTLHASAMDSTDEEEEEKEEQEEENSTTTASDTKSATSDAETMPLLPIVLRDDASLKQLPRPATASVLASTAVAASSASSSSATVAGRKSAKKTMSLLDFHAVADASAELHRLMLAKAQERAQARAKAQAKAVEDAKRRRDVEAAAELKLAGRVRGQKLKHKAKQSMMRITPLLTLPNARLEQEQQEEQQEPSWERYHVVQAKGNTTTQYLVLNISLGYFSCKMAGRLEGVLHAVMKELFEFGDTARKLRFYVCRDHKALGMVVFVHFATLDIARSWHQSAMSARSLAFRMSPCFVDAHSADTDPLWLSIAPSPMGPPQQAQ